MEGETMSRNAEVSDPGGYPLGFRLGPSEWQKDIGAAARWAGQNGFSFLDVIGGDAGAIEAVRGAGLRVGSADLGTFAGFKTLITASKQERAKAVESVSNWIRTASGKGVRIFFTIMLPSDPKRSARDNFADMVEGYGALQPVLEATGSRIAIEGWPGPGALCCTPETLRRFFGALSSPSYGINYDPSHLLRMGIDAYRFIDEFSERIVHVHAKDTVWMRDYLYEFGHELKGVFADPISFGAWAWRYTIPGEGTLDWGAVLGSLKQAGYQGGVSVELEDANFNGTTEGEQRALRRSIATLAGRTGGD